MGRTLDVLELLSHNGREARLLREAVVRGKVPLERVQEAADQLWQQRTQVNAALLLDHLLDSGGMSADLVARLTSELFPALETVDSPATAATDEHHSRADSSPASPVRRAAAAVAERLDPFDELPIKEWDRYELVEFIGRGGMGDVFKARDPRLERHVAIKVLRRDEPQVLARFTREAQVQARIDHDNVCPVYEVGQVHGRHYIAMQYVAGGSLKEISDLVTVDEKAAIMADVADALHAAHRVGLIHRDIKPANIMVERDADGGWHPYVVDFGIARDLDSHDLTATGAMLGTPAFAAPEQVRGDSQALDARTDVYSLGATLYWFLTERSPFEGGYPEILAGVTHDDPTPPRRFNPQVPPDLETIILKCLEKEPDRRYASAREVAEDLRRYLNGEAIEARRASLVYRLGKRIRKNRSMAAVLGIAALIILALVTQLVRTGIAARQAQLLAQRFGGSVEEMESIMRTASMMPLHDRSAERARIELKMAAIEREMSSLGELAAGPGHYALGRGELALQSWEAALDHLRSAWDAGYRGPELSYALGLALGQIYDKRLRDAQATADVDAREAAVAAVRSAYRDPALAHLRAGAALDLESTAYVEGLIAYYEEHFDAALELARRAVAEVPSLFAARRLEGEVLMAMGDQLTGRGEVSRAIAAFQSAGEAFREACNIARSDAASYDGDCGRWLRTMEVQIRFGLAADTALGQALSRCEQSIRIDPYRADPHEKVARAHLLWADHLNDSGQDPGPSLSAAEAAARKALEHNPTSFAARHALGRIATIAGLHAASRGRDPRPQLEDAVEHFTRAIAIEPASVQAHDDLGYALERTARFLLSKGIDPRPVLDAAADSYRRAIAINPQVANPHNNLGIALWRRAVYELRAGDDPSTSLDAAVASLERAVAANQSYANAHAMLGFVHTTRAQYLFDRGSEPRAALDAARRSFARAEQLNPSMPWLYPELATTELLTARWQMKHGQSPDEGLRAAATAADRALDLNPSNPVALQTAAEVHYWRARWLLAEGRGARFEVESGRRLIDRALTTNPDMATARRTLGALILTQAETESGPTRRALAREALLAFAQAIAANPLLSDQIAPLRERARDIADAG